MAQKIRNQVSVALDEGMAGWLDGLAERLSRGRSGAAQLILSMMKDLMARELSLVPFTVGEAVFLGQVYEGAVLSPQWGPLIVCADVKDELSYVGKLPGGMSVCEEEFNFSADALLAKLQDLSPLADFALRTALTEWCSSATKPADYAASFAQFGLRIIDENPSLVRVAAGATVEDLGDNHYRVTVSLDQFPNVAMARQGDPSGTEEVVIDLVDSDQTGHRITDQLHDQYPGSWQWADASTLEVCDPQPIKE